MKNQLKEAVERYHNAFDFGSAVDQIDLESLDDLGIEKMIQLIDLSIFYNVDLVNTVVFSSAMSDAGWDTGNVDFGEDFESPDFDFGIDGDGESFCGDGVDGFDFGLDDSDDDDIDF